MLDRILTFLFRRKIGLILLLGSVCCSAFIMSGCFSWSMLSCFCDNMGCEACASCYSGCDQACSCNTGCDLIDCMFGNGCTSDCGGCGSADCGGCNSTLFTSCEDDTCEGCLDGCQMDCGNYSFTGSKRATKTYGFTVNYSVRDNQNRVIATHQSMYKSFTRSEAEGGSPEEVTINYSDKVSSKYFNLIRVLDENQNVISTDGTSLVFDTSDWKDDVLNKEVTVTFIVEEKGYGESVNIEVEYKGVEKANEYLTATVGSAFPTLEAPQIEGYTFDGYYMLDSEGKEKKFDCTGTFSLFEYGIDPDAGALELKIYAKYNPISYTVTVHKVVDGKVNVGEEKPASYDMGVDTIIMICKEIDKLGVDTEKEKFICWAYDSKGERKVNDRDIITEDMSLYCIYRTPIKVTFKNTVKPGEGEKVVDAFSGDKLGAEINLPQPPINGKYSFSNWCLDEKLTKDVELNQAITQNTTLYAKWVEQSIYQAKFYKDLTNYKNSNPWSTLSKSFNYKEGLTLPGETDVLPMQGYKFVGWRIINADGTVSSNIVTSIEKGKYETDMNFVAVYSRKIKLVPSGGTVSGTTDFVVYYGESFDLPVPRSSTVGKEFDSWSYDSAVSGASITDNKGHGDSFDLAIYDNSETTYLVPIWVNCRYAVKFVSDGTDIKVINNVEHGDVVTAPSQAPLKAGYDFVGWYNGAEQFDATKPVTANVTYTAKWSAKTYTITLLNSDGSKFGEKQVKFGERINLGVPTSPSGRTFVAWVDDRNMEWAGQNGQMVRDYDLTKNLTLKAREV